MNMIIWTSLKSFAERNILAQFLSSRAEELEFLISSFSIFQGSKTPDFTLFYVPAQENS